MFLKTSFDGFIINIGDVSNEIHFVIIKLKHSTKNIGEKKSTKIPNMNSIVDCWATTIDTNHSACEWFEFFFFSGECVVELDYSHFLYLKKPNVVTATASMVSMMTVKPLG